MFAAGSQFDPSALGKRLHAKVAEHLVCVAEFGAGVASTSLTAEPFPVKQVRSRHVDSDSCAGQPVEGLCVQFFGALVVYQQCV